MLTKKAQGVAKIGSNMFDYVIYPTRLSSWMKALQDNAVLTSRWSVQNPKTKFSLKLAAKCFGFNGSRWDLLYFPFKEPQMLQWLLYGNNKMSHLSQSINQVPNGHVSTYKKKKSQLALIGILACSFCGEFSNRHGSRTPSISPQERSPQQTKSLLVLALGSFVTITGAMYRTLALWVGTGVPWEWKTPCAAGCSQAGLSSWPWRAGTFGDSAGGSCLGHGMLP